MACGGGGSKPPMTPDKESAEDGGAPAPAPSTPAY
jgi:hypothetical protein